MNGVPMVGVVVIPQPGANHIEIADAVYERMEQMKKDLPEDVSFSYGFDNTKFIRASIAEDTCRLKCFKTTGPSP